MSLACSVSFSEEAPQVKFIPGSAEQRGTNFVLALSGERPFCRPLKHGGGYFLLTAEVDGQNKDSIFLGLQVCIMASDWSMNILMTNKICCSLPFPMILLFVCTLHSTLDAGQYAVTRRCDLCGTMNRLY